MTIIYLKDNFGKNLFGTCKYIFFNKNLYKKIIIFQGSVKAISHLPLFSPILVIIYLICAIVALYKFKKNVPNNKQFEKPKKEFLNYYLLYVISCTIIWYLII